MERRNSQERGDDGVPHQRPEASAAFLVQPKVLHSDISADTALSTGAPLTGCGIPCFSPGSGLLGRKSFSAACAIFADLSAAFCRFTINIAVRTLQEVREPIIIVEITLHSHHIHLHSYNVHYIGVKNLYVSTAFTFTCTVTPTCTLTFSMLGVLRRS